mmetsp:Transcript_95247/g.226839  ORF Transcript_95247/g.226839 Transcript_95247/m.226839 type:complete len:604 (+) Transcript_95247:112-1923(+)|eukprot:CAMPEP_0181426574 /NCGR_PEP_ID=MMETSP1110-20121109/15732_1 /TAXON_ID=174948 /ORGANISM="Symbiodinium sp., Strain CCMP421" /LENGTH=603 /DNA_ID=CAMNT_0023549771 /DNA_START=85 /DNA_END=1896 /DNA_ORIENTATION=-
MAVTESNGHEQAAKKPRLEERLPPMNVQKYRSFQSWYQIPFDENWPKRSWPEKRLTKAPRWCTVDLRDGNQALINPMNHEKKLRLFLHLLKLGYKEIEVGFPAASQTDFDFIRYVIEEGLVPDDCWIQVLTQCREPLILRTIEGVKGAKNVVIHVYNSTSELQRRVVFKKGREEIKNLAIESVGLVKKLVKERMAGTNVRLEYSPESFTGTELDFALDVCNGVVDVWEPTPENQVILNLPGTVEMATPNVYADQIEWMCAHIKKRDCVCISIHPHNDRGTGIAAAELAVMAGADRVEGCLFGNGERTGNVCLVTLALNFFTQGIDPEVSYNSLEETIGVAEYCTELKVPERYPWAGSLVYTAFSGSHQDAIKKGLEANKKATIWEVPYLPIDPQDIGRHYEAIIRVNSQSGKGGIAYILEQEYGIALPKDCQAEFAQVVQKISDKTSREIAFQQIWDAFYQTYILPQEPMALLDYELTKATGDEVELKARVRACGKEHEILGKGNGPVSAFVGGLNRSVFGAQGMEVHLSDYHSEARSQCKNAEGSEAVASVRCQAVTKTDQVKTGKPRFGVGLHMNTNTAVLKAVISGINCLCAAGDAKLFA